MLTSRQNHKARKDFLLTKISQAKKVTSAMDNKSKIIETARQKQKCMIEDDTKIVSDATDEENLEPNIVRKDFSMEVQDKKEVSCADNNVSQKASARSISIETPGTSKDNFTYGSDTSGEKSPSSICNAYSPSELRQMSPITSHMTALASSPSTPRSSRQSGSIFGVPGATYDMKAFEKKMYVSNQEISSKLDMLIMNVCRLNRFLLPHEKRIVRPAHFPALPLITEERLEKFEKYLSKDDNAAATICYVSQIIGPKDNIKEAVYKVLRKLISNTLAAQFTLKAGKNVSKKCFEKLALYEVVQGAILDKRPQAELPEIDVATSLWLKQAPWRRQDDGSMGKRTKK